MGDVHAFLKGHGADGRRLEGGHLADDDHQSGVPLRRFAGIWGVLVAQVLAQQVTVRVVLVADEFRVAGGRCGI